MPADVSRPKPWVTRDASLFREFCEVVAAIAVVTVAGWFMPISYEAFGHIYLFAVIALSLRVGRKPALAAAVLSAAAWEFFFVPPRLSFSILRLDDVLLLGTYFVVALVGSQLTSRIRAEQIEERRRERRATALFHLTRALAGARTLDEAAEAALRQADELFEARCALLLKSDGAELLVHGSSSFHVDETERAVAEWVSQQGEPAGRFTTMMPAAAGLHVPMQRAGIVVGVFAVRFPPSVSRLTMPQRDLISGFAAQIALLVEREQLRFASDREKLLAESERLYRTLFDSVSHELKTPLSVLRTAAEKLDTNDARKRASLTAEVRTATQRLDHLVANLLNQTRLESGMLRPQLDWCDVHDLVRAARRACDSALAERTVTLALPADLPLLQADAPLMEQVLANLLLNAAQHTPAGCRIMVSAGIEADRMFIAVADDGPGIPPEVAAHLFQKFHRGPQARAGGLGLGLTIARGFTLAQGGEITVEKSPAGGAQFTVYLPYTAHDGVPNDDP